MDNISSVTSDNFDGGRKAAELLTSLGHKRIGYIAGWEGASTQRDREAGFLEGLKEAGQTLFAREVGDFHTDRTEKATISMFDKPADERPDAVFAANDHMAFKVMDILRYDLGLRIPEDVSVIGYDDVPPAAWRAYDLTTLRQRANIMVEQTVETILHHIEQQEYAHPKRIKIESPLIIRSTTRAR